jgi:hypothetical protein
MASENGVLDELDVPVEVVELVLLEDAKMFVPEPFTVIDVAMPIPLSGFSNSSGTCFAPVASV